VKSLSLSDPTAAHADRLPRSRTYQRLACAAVEKPLRYEFDGQKLKNRHLGTGDWEALISPKTYAQVRKQMENLVNAVSGRAPIGKSIELKRPPGNSVGAAASEVLSIPPLIYREYAAEYKELARRATNDSERALYLKMANTWRYAAVRFENGSISDRG